MKKRRHQEFKILGGKSVTSKALEAAEPYVKAEAARVPARLPMIRALWGSEARNCYKRCKRDVDKFSGTLTSELETGQWMVVYCFGKENEKIIKGMGLETRLVCDTPLLFPEGPGAGMGTGKASNWTHKIEAVSLAVEEFGEILYTDWGTEQLRPLDDEFYQRLQDGGSVQVPLVGYRRSYANCRHQNGNMLPAGAWVYYRGDERSKAVLNGVRECLQFVRYDDEKAMAMAVDELNGGWRGRDWWAENMEPQDVVRYRIGRCQSGTCENPYFKI